MRALPENIETILQSIAERLLDAVLQQHRNNEEARELVLEVDHRQPLGPYFMRVARYALTYDISLFTAAGFKDTLADADALELIFEDARPALERGGLSNEAKLYYGLAAAAVKNLQHLAYTDGHLLH